MLLLTAALLTTPPAQPAAPTAESASPPLRIAQKLSPRRERGAVVLQAPLIEGKSGGQLTASGGVRLRHGETLLRAPQLRYDESTDEVQTDTEVSIEHLGNKLQGKRLRLQLDAFIGELLEPTYTLQLTGGSGRAARMDFLGDERLRAEGATYSSCPRDEGDTGKEPAWELRTTRLELDLPANEGRATGAVLRFQGVPILAAPSFSFPLTSERKSGWLPPHIGADNRSGIELAVPYYFNLAPNYDLTLTPFVMTRRGFGSDVEVRGLQPWGGASVATSLLPNDRVNGEKRWLWASEGELRVWEGGGAQWRAEGVSDDEIWKDMRRRIASDQPRLLARDASAEQRFEGWGLSGGVYARTLSWQVAQTAEAETRITAPYQRAPQVGLRLRNQADVGLLAGFLPVLARPQLETALELEYNRFTLPRAALGTQTPGGERAHLLASVALPLLDPAWWLVPRLSLNAAAYRTEAPMSDGRRRASRSVPTFSLDSGLVFERNTSVGGRALLQSLEPRLLYVQTPYRAQETLPLYDSAPLDFNVESLYATNSFSGVDRVADARQLSVGGVSRWLNADDGEEQLRAGIVQRYQFRDQRITGDPSTAGRKASDLLVSGAAHLTRAWWLDGALQFDPDAGRTERSVLRARYTTTDYRSVSLAYRLTRGQSEQLDLAWQWPLTKRSGSGECAGRWLSAGRVQYSMKDSRVTDSLAGLEYDAGCWVLRFGIERLSTGLSQANTRFLLQLELVGLSRLGSNALKVLRDNVPGYRPLASDSGLSTLP